MMNNVYYGTTSNKKSGVKRHFFSFILILCLGVLSLFSFMPKNSLSVYAYSGQNDDSNINYSAYVDTNVYWYNGQTLVCYVNFVKLDDFTFSSSYSVYAYDCDNNTILSSKIGYYNDPTSVYFTYDNGVCADDWSNLGIYVVSGNTSYYICGTKYYTENIGYDNGYYKGRLDLIS